MPVPVPPNAECHVAGVLVRTLRERTCEAAAAIGDLPGTEVRALAEDGGRVVVVCEADSGRGLRERIEAMRAIPGVVDAALVYQHCESAEAMEETIEHEDHAP